MSSFHVIITALTTVAMTISCASCKNATKSHSGSDADTVALVGPTFCADSAYQYIDKQCSFGPRTMNSKAHDECGKWIVAKFQSLGYEVTEQRADLKGYDGTTLKSTNIIAKYRPELTNRILLCSHWDSRPWADNDPDTANHRKPVLGANDGASGVGVLLEVARLLREDTTAQIGIDFVCFDAEDWGVPEWENGYDGDDSWALGANHWAKNQPQGYKPRYGILLDMVGGQGARFYQEGFSLHFAADIVRQVWSTAHAIGYSSYFPMTEGSTVTDDHLPINESAGIPTIDIIPYYPDCPQSSFGTTWHTVNDDMAHIDKNALKAVGQVIIQTIYTEK